MHLLVLTRQIGNYHNARYASAAEKVDRLTVLSTTNRAAFSQFLAINPIGYDIVRLFSDRAAYDGAVRAGNIGPALHVELAGLKPDVIAISGWTTPETMATIRWARENSVPIVIMSESQEDDANRSFLREAIKSRIVSQCDAALVGGSPHAAYIASLGIPEDRIFFGYNAVDNTHFEIGSRNARSRARPVNVGFDLPAEYILASSRFIKKKNLPTLIAAYARAVRTLDIEVPDLVILGDGETKPAMLKAALDCQVMHRLHLPGFVGYDVLPTIYGLADAFVHVATVEQWGLVINEAMASGLPTIVSDSCGAARSLVDDGVSGLLVKPNIESITSGLTRFFKMTSAEKVKMGKFAAGVVASWGPERFADGLASAVNCALTAPRRGGPTLWDSFIMNRIERRIIERVA
ncbi:MAG: glycosyltransferase [Cyanobacteria bacterium P01_F01_bin.33]